MGVESANISGTNDGKTTFDPACGHLVNDGTNNRVLIGKQSDGTDGIFVSKPGQEVLGATGNQLIMSSQFNSFKIVGTGTTIVTSPANTGTTETQIPHGLGYQPGIIAYINVVNAYWPSPFIQFNQTNGANLEQTRACVDDVNVYFDIYCPSSSGTNPLYTSAVSRAFRYYLLQETAS